MKKNMRRFFLFLPLGFFIFYLVVAYIPGIIMGEPSGGQPMNWLAYISMLGFASVIAFGNLVFYFVYFLVKNIYITPRLRPLFFAYGALVLFAFLRPLSVWLNHPQIYGVLFIPGRKFGEMAFDIIYPEIKKEKLEMQRRFIEDERARERQELAIKSSYEPPCNKTLTEMMAVDYQARGHDMLLQVDEKNRIYLQASLEYKPRWQITEIMFLRFEENGVMNQEFQLHLNCLLPGFITENGIRESPYLGNIFAAPASDEGSILFLVNKGVFTQDQKVQQFLYFPESQTPHLETMESTGLKADLFAFGTQGNVFYASDREYNKTNTVRSDSQSGKLFSVKLDPLVIGRIDLQDKKTVSSVFYNLNSKNELNSQDSFKIASFYVMPNNDVVAIINAENMLEEPRYKIYYLRVSAEGIEKEFRILNLKTAEDRPYYYDHPDKMVPLAGGQVLVYGHKSVLRLFDVAGDEVPEFGENAGRWISSNISGGIVTAREDLKGRIIVAGMGKDGKPVMTAFLASGYPDASFLPLFSEIQDSAGL